MNMMEFYAKYNLNKYEFAEIAGVGIKSLVKYGKGEPLREDTKERIEKAMRVAEKYNLIRPKFNGPHFDAVANMKHFSLVNKYKDNFKRLNEEET